jgi:3-oxoacyl-[acyl-carrier-protein] synthase II
MAVVTGWGAVSCLGLGAQALWRGLELGEDGMSPIQRFSTEGFRVDIAALVPHCNSTAAGRRSTSELCAEYAIEAAREAYRAAGLERSTVPADRVALVMGTSPGPEVDRVFELTEQVADALGIKGPRITVSTACTSSTNALGLGIDLLAQGMADVVVAGGSDVLTPIMFAGFHALGVLSREKCAPFSESFGTTLGEGAGFLILERSEGVMRRAGPSRASLSGYGLSGDAFHETGPDPTGSGVARAIRGALAYAHLAPDDIGYVNAHGTGTLANDPAEWRALRSVFGERAKALPTSSTKSVLGHAQAAAGALEVIATLEARNRHMVPQTLHLKTPRPNCPSDPVAQDTPRPGTFRHAVSTNSAFGGANAAVVIGDPVDEKVSAGSSRRIYVTGVGAALPGPMPVAELLRRLGLGAQSPSVSHREVGGRGPAIDPQSLDPSTHMLMDSLALALDDAGIGPIRGSIRDEAGLVCGINSVSPQSIRELRASIEERGLPFLSANAFSRMVLNAPAGTCSKCFSLRGPLSTLSIGRGSGLLAILYAAMHLERREGIKLMLAGGVDEGDSSDTAGCVVLGGAPPSVASGRTVRLAGWGIAGPSGVERAIEQALASASIRDDDVELTLGASHALGGGDAAGSALDFIAATLSLRFGGARTALVIATGGASSTCAAVLEARGG